MTDSITIQLSKYQGFKEVDFGKPFGKLKLRPLGSNEGLEINKVTRESIKSINELMAFHEEIKNIDLSTVSDDDKELAAKIERSNKLIAKREKMSAREIEIYTGCFASDCRSKGAEMISGLSSIALQELWSDIFNVVKKNDKAEDGE